MTGVGCVAVVGCMAAVGGCMMGVGCMAAVGFMAGPGCMATVGCLAVGSCCQGIGSRPNLCFQLCEPGISADHVMFTWPMPKPGMTAIMACLHEGHLGREALHSWLGHVAQKKWPQLRPATKGLLPSRQTAHTWLSSMAEVSDVFQGKANMNC